MTHFGSSEDVDAQLAEVSARLDDWANRVGEVDADTFVASMLEEVTQGASDPDLLPTYMQAAPPQQMYAGLERYLRKRAESASKSRVS
jgi:hypothetical protein